MIAAERRASRQRALSGRTYGAELSALDVSEGIVINADRSLGCGVRIDAPYTPTQSDDLIAEAYDRLAGFLNSLPAHFDVQIIWTQHSRTRELAERLAAVPYSAGLAGEVQAEQEQNLLALLRQGHLRWIEVYFLLLRKPADDQPALAAPAEAKNFAVWAARMWRVFVGAKGTLALITAAQQAAAAELRLQLRTLTEVLAGLGWNPVPADDAAVRRLFFQRWNPRQFSTGSGPLPPRSGHPAPLTESYAVSAFTWDPSGYAQLDGWWHALLTLHEPPENLRRPAFDELLLLAGLARAEMVVNIERGDPLRRIKRLQTLLGQRQTDPQTVSDPAERGATVQLTEELEEMGAQSEGTWRAACYLHLWAPSEAGIRESVAQTLSAARARDAVFVHEQRALWPYWRAMQPFWTRDRDRYRLLDYSTRQLVRLLPLFGQPTNLAPDKAVGVLYQTASRSVYNWIVPDESLFANPHHLLVGGTGSGKSVLQDENLIAMRRRGAKAIIIDLGGSFVNFCAASGGVYIDYDIRSRANRLNPLWLPPGSIPDAEFLRARALWLETLVGERGQRLPSDDLIVLEQALRRTYHRNPGEPVYLRDLRGALLQDSRGVPLAHRLALWCEDGSFANLFDGPSQIDLSAPVLVFDLKRVVHDQRDADLARVIFNSIVGAVTALALAAGPEPKFLTFDEAGVMLKDPATAEFMEYCFRTLRKTGVAVGAISQALEDFLAQPHARNAFVGAADNLFVLKQDSHDKARQIAEEKQLGPEELRLMQSITTVPGSHAEFLLVQKTTHGSRTLHLISASTPLKYAFTANSPEDRRALTAFEAAGLSRADAVRRFAAEHPRGLLSSRLLPPAAIMVAALVLGAAWCGCMASPRIPANAGAALDDARREERLRIMQRSWAERQALPLGPDRSRDTSTLPAPVPTVTYPAGSYDGVRFAARTAASPELIDPVR